MMLAVFSFGGAYLMSNSWRDMPAKAMILSILWAAFSALLASRLPNMAYNMAGIIIPYHFFYIWIGLSFFPGVPIMMFIFKKYGE